MGSNPSEDPPAVDPTLLAQLRDLDRSISEHERLKRTIPLHVLQPQVEEALTRVRRRMSELALPKGAAAIREARFNMGEEVAVAMSPERRGIVLGAFTEPETGKRSRILLVEGGEVVTATEEEIRPAGPAPFMPPVLTSPQQPPGQAAGAISPPLSVSTGIRPGDTVDTPLGLGKVVQEVPGSPGVFEIAGVPNSPVYLRSEELRVRTP